MCSIIRADGDDRYLQLICKERWEKELRELEIFTGEVVDKGLVRRDIPNRRNGACQGVGARDNAGCLEKSNVSEQLEYVHESVRGQTAQGLGYHSVESGFDRVETPCIHLRILNRRGL